MFLQTMYGNHKIIFFMMGVGSFVPLLLTKNKKKDKKKIVEDGEDKSSFSKDIQKVKPIEDDKNITRRKSITATREKESH